MSKWKAETGMSLVEATIILMVLAILTSVVAPSVADYVNDARQTKAKEDVEALGTGLARLLRDVGKPCLTSTASAACTIADRVELLISGSIAGAEATSTEIDSAALSTDSTAATLPASTASATTLDWGGAGANRPDNVQTFDQHLVTNDNVAYTAVSFTSGGGPRAGLGWRGAYVSGPVGLDPWGRRYQANTVYLNVASNAAAGTGNGQREGGWTADTIVISPGGNGIVETLFGGTTNTGSVAAGDDVIYTIKGATR